MGKSSDPGEPSPYSEVQSPPKYRDSVSSQSPRKPKTPRQKKSEGEQGDDAAESGSGRSPRHRIPTRTEGMITHDKMMREIVDPQRFAQAYHVSEKDVEPKKLNIDQLQSLIRGLVVKTRGSASVVSYTKEQGPGPGAYDVRPDAIPPLPGPRFQPDIREGGSRFAMSEQSRFPGPGTYLPQSGMSSRLRAAPMYSMSSRLTDTITQGIRRVQPAPGQYNPYKPLGDDAPKFSLHDRSPYNYAAIVPQGPGPGAYNLPSTLRGNAIGDWSPVREGSYQPSSGVLPPRGMAEEIEERTRNQRRLQNSRNGSRPQTQQSPRTPRQGNSSQSPRSHNKQQGASQGNPSSSSPPAESGQSTNATSGNQPTSEEA